MTAEFSPRQKMTSLYTRRESFRLFVSSADQTTTMCLCVSVWADIIHLHTSLGEASVNKTKVGAASQWLLIGWLQIASSWFPCINLNSNDSNKWNHISRFGHFCSFLVESLITAVSMVKCLQLWNVQGDNTHLQTLSWKPIPKPCRQVLKAFCFVVKCVLKKWETSPF